MASLISTLILTCFLIQLTTIYVRSENVNTLSEVSTNSQIAFDKMNENSCSSTETERPISTYEADNEDTEQKGLDTGLIDQELIKLNDSNSETFSESIMETEARKKKGGGRGHHHGKHGR